MALIALVLAFFFAPVAGNALASDLHDLTRWSTFDPSAQGVGSSPIGFNGAAFDGRYVYFSPHWDSSSEVMRYDTQGDFDATTSWATYDPGSRGGYAGTCFDGRYVYFSPKGMDGGLHGEALRYDTAGAFDSPSSWSVFDTVAASIGTDTRAYWGALCSDDGFVYFAPAMNGEVLRYDRSLSFTDAASWAAYDPGANGVGTLPAGYKGVVSDGSYVYFVPYWNNNNPPTAGSHGQMLRYDPSLPFASTSSWASFTPIDAGVGSIGKGYEGAVYDGRYLYFVPSYAGWGVDFYHGEVMRYDTTAPFAMASSWVAYDPGDTGGVGVDPDGYNEAFFDGRYIYFAPTNHGNPDGPHGEVLRYDTSGGFTSAASWDTFDPGSNGIGIDPDGYAGLVSDGRYLYFVPDRNETNVPHGEVLRYEFAPRIPLMSVWGLALTMAAMLGSGAIAARRARRRSGRSAL